MVKTAVILMSYGTPSLADEIKSYYTNIRQGVEPTTEEIKDLTRRYAAIGGLSPLKERTERQGQKLEELLGTNFKVYLAYRYVKPMISETLQRINQDGFERIIAVNLTPFSSEFVNNTYFAEVERVAEQLHLNVNYVANWSQESDFYTYWCRAITETIDNSKHSNLKSDDSLQIIFTAHSLPRYIIDNGDAYETSIKKTINALAENLSLTNYTLGWQSAGTKGDWLRPTVKERIQEVAKNGGKNIILVPVGFVSDHLEILYDLDLMILELCKKLNINYSRVPMPNDNSIFIGALATHILNEVK